MDNMNNDGYFQQENHNESDQQMHAASNPQDFYNDPQYVRPQQYQPSPLPLKSLKNWSTFQAVLEIIQGAVLCLGIITAIVGVPKIIAGVKLLNAGDDLQSHMQTGDPRKMDSSIYNITAYFRLNGVSNIINICTNILTILILIIFIGLIISKIPEWIQNFNFSIDI